MSCAQLTAPPPIPSLPAGFSLPGFSPPSLPGVNVCCKLNLPPIPLPNIHGIPIPAAALQVITDGLLLVEKVLDALDSVNLKCPLD